MAVKDEKMNLRLDGPYSRTTIYLWTQTVWGHSWPSDVWTRARGSGPSLANQEGKKSEDKEEEEEKKGEKEDGFEEARL